MSNPYSTPLPARPDLAQQRKRAKDLLKALRAGAPEALARFRYNDPCAANDSSDALRAAARLSDAQWVIARECGFASWPRLKAYIDGLNGGAAERAHAFETDLQYYRDRAAGMRSVLATGERNAIRLVRRFHPGFSDASEEAIRSAEITQQDAELISAREHGFESFHELAAHVEALRTGKASDPFRGAFEAIRDNDRANLDTVLAAHPDVVNARGTNGNRLLSIAVYMNRTLLIDALLAAGADPDSPNNKGWTALHQAAYGWHQGAYGADLTMIERMLRAGASVEAEAYGDGGTPLAVALFWGNREAAERLAQVAIVPKNLRVAAALGRLDLMESMFAPSGELQPAAGFHREFHRPHSGFPPWQPTDDPAEIVNEALGWAARNGRIDAMAYLVARGADVNSEPYVGAALHWAVRMDRPEAVIWLLDHGADIDRRAGFGGVRGITPLHAAAAWKARESCARLLIERGADMTMLDPAFDSTPMGWARHFGNDALADEMLELGSRRDIFVAVIAGRPDRIAALLDRQPTLIRAHNSAGLTPLAFARAQAQANETIVALLSRYAEEPNDPHLKNEGLPRA